MKKTPFLLMFAMAIVLTVSSNMTAQAAILPAGYPIYGDVTGDKVIDTKDILEINSYRFGKKPFTENQKKLADVNNDKKIDIKDIERINQHRLKGASTPSAKIVTVFFDYGSSIGKSNALKGRPYNGNDKYGSIFTPSQSGYTFLGWYTEKSGGIKVTNNSSVGTKNHVLYAHYKKKDPVKYYIDLNGFLDGKTAWDIKNYGTVDVYISGNRVANDVADYYAQWPVGTKYEIKDIKARSGYSYKGVKNGTLKGTIGNSAVNIQLSFNKNQISKINKALKWCDGKKGKKVGSGQCVAFIQAYYKYLGVNSVKGNACDYAKNSLPKGWKRVKGGVPQVGDILVYTGGKYGHVAIYAGGTTVYQQNIKGKFVEKNTNWKYNKSWYSKAEKGTKKYWGYIRPDWSK